MPKHDTFQITPEEDRFLRGFVRRHAGRYMLIAGVLLGLALWLGRGSGDAAVPEQWHAELNGLRAAHQELQVEMARLREESQRLGAELEGVGARMQSVDAAARQGGNLDQRMAGALRRLDQVESRVGQTAGTPSGDLASVLQRMQSVEARQEREVRGRETFEKSVLNRLYAVEGRVARQGPAAHVPASPAP